MEPQVDPRHTATAAPRPWPAPVRWAALALAAWHVGAVFVNVGAARSGPLVASGTPQRLPPPPWAPAWLVRAAHQYLAALRLDETGRFPGIYAPGAAGRFEILAPDGAVVAAWPDPRAWWPVRHWQQAFATGLLTDVPAEPDAAGERSYAPGQQHTRLVWRAPAPDRPATLVEIAEHELPRDPQRREQGPTAWQQAVAAAAARRLGGEGAVLRRYALPLSAPALLFAPPAASFDDARAELAPVLAEPAAEYRRATP
jgi:hypothetical protein